MENFIIKLNNLIENSHGLKEDDKKALSYIFSKIDKTSEGNIIKNFLNKKGDLLVNCPKCNSSTILERKCISKRHIKLEY